MIRCKPLLGTFVEISIRENEDGLEAIENAFNAIQKVNGLMGFHHPESELSLINQLAHKEAVEVHPWTAQVIKIAKEVYLASDGLFNCGIGHRLVAAGLLPQHTTYTNHDLGGIEDIHFIDPQTLRASKPVCLDLGGIAKGFAVDKAVESLLASGIQSGCVNAGGDLRVFGTARPVQIRNPSRPNQLIDIGSLQNGAIATSGLYFSNRDQEQSHIINPFAKDESEAHLHFSGSYSVLANECVYADALTKVLALSNLRDHACFTHFSAKTIKIAA